MGNNEITPEERALRDALARHLCALIVDGSLDEVRVLYEIGSRVLGGGLDNYGRLHIASDRRNFEHEAGDELADAVFYVACEFLRRKGRQIERRHGVASAESAKWAALELTRQEAMLNGPPCGCWRVPIERLEITGHVADCREAHRYDVTQLDAEIREGFNSRDGGRDG